MFALALARILAERDYGPPRDLSALQALQNRRGLRQGGRVLVGPQHALRGQREDLWQVVARAEVAAADGDAFEDGIDQGQFVVRSREADQHQSAVALERAESLRDGGGRGGEDDAGIGAARGGLGARGGGQTQRLLAGGGPGHAPTPVAPALPGERPTPAAAAERHPLGAGPQG